MEVNFEFAKKMSRMQKGVPGISLRSMEGSPEKCAMIIMADSYEDIRSQVANYRMLTGRSIKAAARGKTLEIKTEAVAAEDVDAISSMFQFAQALKFNSEEAKDVTEFWQVAVMSGDYPAVKPDIIQLSEGSMWLSVTAYIDDEDSPDTIYSSFDHVCEKYGIGMVKKHPDKL